MNDNVHVNVPTTAPGMTPDYIHPRFLKYLQESVQKATREAAEDVDYPQVLRYFDHEELAKSPSYHALRLALSCVANESHETDPELTLAGFLDAVRDMVATTIYGDMCKDCSQACHAEKHLHDGEEYPLSCGSYRTVWPYGGEPAGDGMRCWYTCENGHGWECTWGINPRAWAGLE